MRKIQLPAIGGIRKVIEIPDAGTTIAEIGSGSITLAQLAKLITVQQQNATAATSNTVGDGTEAVLKVGANLSGGGVMLGTVNLRNDYFSPAYSLQEDGPDAPPQIYPPQPRASQPQVPQAWTQPDNEFDESMLPAINYPASTSTGGVSFANPTASIGLTAVNGSATTAMRSDAAPALSVAITPTWTSLHTFSAALVSDGPANVAALTANGSSTSGQSRGLEVFAGTTAADHAVYMANQANSAVFFKINGDGSGQLGVSNSLNISWDNSGNFYFPQGVEFQQSGAALYVPGANNYPAIKIIGSGTTGQSFGAEIHAGTNGSDAAITAYNSAASTLLFRVKGDGSGQIGNGTSNSMTWDGSGNFNFPGALSMTAPASGTAFIVPGAANAFALKVIANTTSSQSFGLEILAGTNGSDSPITVYDTSSNLLFRLKGDGSGQIGPHSANISWDASGNVTLPANLALTATTGTTLIVPGVAGSYALQVAGSSTVGSSDGLLVQASTNGSDTCAAFYTSGYGALLFRIKGDGSGQLGNGTANLTWDNTGKFSFPSGIGVFGNSPAGQSTGWGTPTGNSVQNNFSGAGASLATCTAAVAQIIATLKAIGIFAA